MVEVMIRLSVEVLWSSQILLKRISEYKIHSTEEVYIKNLSSVNADTLMELASTCRWIVKDNDYFVLSGQGKVLLNTKNFGDRSKVMLYDYIRYITPAWAKRIPYGRQEAFIFMTKDEQACFYEAGLMEDDPDSAVISWWDSVSCLLRRAEDEKKTEIGRKGEYLTVLYEQRRTGIKPQWVSLDSNLSGYDLISQRTKENLSALLIEVKSSERSIATAEFFISVNEWHTGCNAEDYLFYLWSFFGKKQYLAKVSPQQLFKFIPTNNNSGKWQIAKIPYSSFADSFEEIAWEEITNG